MSNNCKRIRNNHKSNHYRHLLIFLLNLCARFREVESQQNNPLPEPIQRQEDEGSQLPQAEPQMQRYSLDDGSFLECTIIDPGTSDQPIISTPKLRNSTCVSGEQQYVAEKRRLKLEKRKLRLQKQQLKLVSLKETIELKQKLMKAKIAYYQSMTENV